MSSDWSTVNAQSTSATATSAATSHHSTPTKPRLVSNRYTHQSVNGEIRRELERYQHSGISFEDFLVNAFAVTPTEMIDLKTEVANAAVHASPAYLHEQTEFATFAADNEPQMYRPFANMSNMVLAALQRGRRIKALDFDGETYVGSRFSQRKPDVVIVPEKDGDTELTMTTVQYLHMLCVLEFKKKPKPKPKNTATTGTAIGKRAREDPGTGADDSLPKRHSSSSSKTKTRISGSQVPPNAAANASGVSVRATTDANPSQGSPSTTDWSIISDTDYVGSTSSCSSSTRPALRERGGKSKGKKSVSNHQQASVPLVGIDSFETTTERAPKSPSDVDVQGALQSDAVQPEGHEAGASEDPSVLRRTNAIRSNAGQPAGVSSNVAARSQSEGGTVINWEVQLANYITEVMSDRSDRTFAFGAIIQETKMRLTYYSRSTYVISEDIDIVKEPELFAFFLVLLSRQTLEKLGFNTDYKFCDPFDTKNEESKPLNVKLDAISGGDNFELKPDTVLELADCIHTEYCLIGRATAVYDVKRPEGCSVDVVLKLSWHAKSKRREDKAILEAREVDAEHSPEIYGVAVLNVKSPSASLKAACTSRPKPYEERELRCLLMRKYNNAEDLSNVEFCAIIPQFIVYVHKLFSEKELLHRDISIFNMAYYEKDNQKIAILIDFDLATFPERQAPSDNTAEPTPSQDNPLGVAAVPNNVHPRPENRSGTTPFMAIETLDLNLPGYKHHLCHELESIFYVIIWHMIGYRHKKGIYPTETNRYNADRKKWDLLKDWRSGSWAQVAKAKVAFVFLPMPVIDFIDPPFLQIVVSRMVDLFSTRQKAFVSRSLYLREMEAGARIKKHPGTQPLWSLPAAAPVAPSPRIDIFPEFGAIWGITGMSCGKSCCVS